MSPAEQQNAAEQNAAEQQRVLRVGTRGSELALTQAGHVRDALIEQGYPAELVIVRTTGDVVMAPVERIGVGVFTQALRDALASGDCDVAVHSHKDLPTALDERFSTIAIPPRVAPEDALIARDGLSLADLPAGAKVGTSAPRRRAQLAALRPDLEVYPVRGNIDTRMGYVHSGQLDAVILAGAGLDRTSRMGVASHRFGTSEMLPAPSQGALAVEARIDDAEASAATASIDHLPSRVRVTAERTLLAVLEAGCTAPVGALAELVGDTLVLHAAAAALDGSSVLRVVVETALPSGWAAGGEAREQALDAAASLGDDAARRLLADGAAELMRTGDVEERAPLVPAESTTAEPTTSATTTPEPPTADPTARTTSPTAASGRFDHDGDC